MKILHLNDTYCNLGGSEKYLLDICNALEERGNEITIISSSENEHISVNGRREYFVKPSYGIRSGLKMWDVYRDIVEKENPDIIHLHNTHYFVSPLIIKRLFRLKPTVKFVHDARLICPHFGRKLISCSNIICHNPMSVKCFRRCYPFYNNERNIFKNIHEFSIVYTELMVLRKLDRIIIGSRYMYEQLLANNVPRNRLTILPLFVTSTDAENIRLTAMKDNPNESVILWVGRFDNSKGERDLLNALALLKTSCWKAYLAGDGLYMDEAVKYAKEKGIYNKVRFLGKIPYGRINELYDECSFVVMPSKVPESFAIVGIEAMAKAKPVIAYDIGAIKEWLIDGITGILVETDNIGQFSIAIKKLLSNKKLTQQLGVNAYQRVKKYYSQEKHFKELINIYKDTIKVRHLNDKNRN